MEQFNYKVIHNTGLPWASELAVVRPTQVKKKWFDGRGQLSSVKMQEQMRQKSKDLRKNTSSVDLEKISQKT